MQIVCWLPLAFVAGSVFGCAPDSQTSESSNDQVVAVSAAASTRDLFRSLEGEIETKFGGRIELQVNTGPSQALAQQILAGSPTDLFVSANIQWADRLRDVGIVKEMVPWLENRLVIVVPARDLNEIGSSEELLQDRFTRVAISGESVPAGIYARQALSHSGTWETLHAEGKIVRGHDVRSTLAYVERGEVDAGIVYETDAKISKRVRLVYRFASDSHDPIRYPLVRIASNNPNDSAARQVFQFLLSPQASQLIENHGFMVVGPPVSIE